MRLHTQQPTYISASPSTCIGLKIKLFALFLGLHTTETRDSHKNAFCLILCQLCLSRLLRYHGLVSYVKLFWIVVARFAC